MKITVHVIYKTDIIDPQGQTVKNALINLDFRNLSKKSHIMRISLI